MCRNGGVTLGTQHPSPTPPLSSYQVVPTCHFKPLSDASLSSTSAAFALVQAPVLSCLHHCSELLFTSRATLFLSHPSEESSAAPGLFPRVRKAWWCPVILRLKSRSLWVAWKASSASSSPRPLLPSLPHPPLVLSLFWHHLPCPGTHPALFPHRAFVHAVPVCWNTLPNHPILHV